MYTKAFICLKCLDAAVEIEIRFVTSISCSVQYLNVWLSCCATQISIDHFNDDRKYILYIYAHV